MFQRQELHPTALVLGLVAASLLGCDAGPHDPDPGSEPATPSAPTASEPGPARDPGDLDAARAAAVGGRRELARGTGTSTANVRVRLPERFRVLTRQYFDVRVEATGLASGEATLRLRVDGVDVTRALPAPEITLDNDADPASLDKAWTFRALSFAAAGVRRVEAVVVDGAGRASQTQAIHVQGFPAGPGPRRSIVLYVGDAMGTTYRDASRLVAQSTSGRLREGFFDELQAMDTMPVTGLVMTHALDAVVPDSANTATAWATGNKTVNGALGVFPDNNDFRFRSADVQGTKIYALDNPRVETFWEYLRRRHGYRTGVVTTSDVTDATPAGQAAHSITRNLGHDIARQYVDGTFVPGPAFDVILGGGLERFATRTLASSGDERQLTAELAAGGFTVVSTRRELRALPKGALAPRRLLGLFRTGHMNVAYDKLGLVRPGDEPPPSLGGFTDQPFLDEMTEAAIDVLGAGGAPFVLLVEGASIDKQSHVNHAAGQIWDNIELDKAVKVGRRFAAHDGRTLVLVTADHDQSMHILGVVDSTVPNATLNVRHNQPFSGLTGGVAGFPDYDDEDGDGYPENRNRYKLAVGYRTGDHTGSSVPLTSEGPGALLFTGLYDQTDIFFKMAAALSQPTTFFDLAVRLKDQIPVAGQNF